MKKISILIVLSMICLMLLAACGKTTAPEEGDSAPAASENVEKTDKAENTDKTDKSEKDNKTDEKDAETEDKEKSPEESAEVKKDEPSLDTNYVVENVGSDDKNSNGDVIGNCHFQKLVFTNPNSALKKINEKIAAECESFFKDGSGKEYSDHLANLSDSEKAALTDQPYRAVYDVQNVYVDDKYISIQYIWDWFAGGVHNFGGFGYNFDIKTGKEIHFADLFASEADAAKAFSGALNEMIEGNPDVFFADAANTVANYDMNSVKFSLVDGLICIYIDQYELASGALGSFTVPIER